MNGFGFTITDVRYDKVYGTIDRDALFIPNLLIDDISKSAEVILKDVFDLIWNSCGFLKCPAYDDEGTFLGLKT